MNEPTNQQKQMIPSERDKPAGLQLSDFLPVSVYFHDKSYTSGFYFNVAQYSEKQGCKSHLHQISIICQKTA